MTDTEYMRTVTRLSDRDHERLVRYYVKLQPDERIAVHGLQTNISQKRSYQKDLSRIPAYYYATFILAIREYKMVQNQAAPSRRITMKYAAQIDALRETHVKARAPRKPSTLQVLVEKNYDDIKKLRSKKPKPEPWRAIAKQLAQRLGKKISHTGLKNIYEKLEEEGGPLTCG